MPGLKAPSKSFDHPSHSNFGVPPPSAWDLNSLPERSLDSQTRRCWGVRERESILSLVTTPPEPCKSRFFIRMFYFPLTLSKWNWSFSMRPSPRSWVKHNYCDREVNHTSHHQTVAASQNPFMQDQALLKRLTLLCFFPALEVFTEWSYVFCHIILSQPLLQYHLQLIVLPPPRHHNLVDQFVRHLKQVCNRHSVKNVSMNL